MPTYMHSDMVAVCQDVNTKHNVNIVHRCVFVDKLNYIWYTVLLFLMDLVVTICSSNSIKLVDI